MKDSEIFIVGANGQLGLALRSKYPGARHADKDVLDITNQDSVESFDWSGIKVIMNAAAYTNVDGAETQEGRSAAWAVNADAVANLVAVAAHYDITFVHFSSDYVFDGTQKSHTEDEAFAPLSVYGASKAAGDIAVSLAPKFYILRTSWVIGEGKNFVRTMLELGEKGINPSVVDDQIGRLTFTPQIVAAIDLLLTNNAPYGTYNVTNDGDGASWAAIAAETFKLASLNVSVTPVSTEKYYEGKIGIALRPLNSCLVLYKIKSLGFTPVDWHADLEDYIKKEQSS
jgi:dTDP-4-dehydrorhamnose 3,5-epimerase